MKETVVSYPSPRAWMEQNFQKNISFFEKRALASRSIDWTGKNLLVGSICLGALQYAISASAAHRPELAEGLLVRASEGLSEAFAARGGVRERDEAFSIDPR
jgi:hypothetical protein